MNIHVLQTGQVKITQSWRVGRGEGIKRLINTLFDSEFTGWLPIYVWVIEHPEGLVVIDTGIPAAANKRIWFPPFIPLVQRAAIFDMSPELEVGPQLQGIGLSPDDVRWVVLTHLHQDHDGGLHHFPRAEFVVSREEWEAAIGLKGRMNGYLNQRWPTWFQPRLVDFSQASFDPFMGQHELTKLGDILLVPTPGHSPGHLSVILREGDLSIIFAGDASYTEDLLISRTADGIGMDPDAQQETHDRILTYAEQNSTIYLPSHDPGSKDRLLNRSPIRLTREIKD